MKKKSASFTVSPTETARVGINVATGIVIVFNTLMSCSKRAKSCAKRCAFFSAVDQTFFYSDFRSVSLLTEDRVIFPREPSFIFGVFIRECNVS